MTDQLPEQSSPSLGSLAQSSRLRELKTARWILIGVGILQMVVSGFLFTNAEKEVDQAIKKELAGLGPGMVVDQKKLNEFKVDAVKKVKLIYILLVGVGAVFIVCGLVVFKAPVPATLTGLIIYIGIHAAFAMFEPATLAQGIIIKVLIIIGLVKAVQAAFAYKKESEAAGMAAL